MQAAFSDSASTPPPPPPPPPRAQQGEALPKVRAYDRLRGASGGKLSKSFSVDRAGLIGGDVAASGQEDDDGYLQDVLGVEGKEAPSLLAKDLVTYIKLRGPITLHDYMAQASNHAIHGYYQNVSVDKIGSKGDFVTAPEISQLFGEMIGLWCLSTWKSLGEPAAINMIELGPGKGTLMKDILRVAYKFPKFRAALRISLVELSETMRKIQQETLACLGVPVVGAQRQVNAKNAEGIPISWYYMLQQVPQEEGVPTLAIGQEFLDTFPVHQFIYTSKGWREKLVDVDSTTSSPFLFRMVLSSTATPAIKALLMRESPLLLNEQPQRGDIGSSSSVRVPGPIQPRDALDHRGDVPANLSENDGIEISPLALATCEDVAKRIHKTRGAALFLDYGEDFTQSDSLRAFKKHAQINILSEPGVADITADVDFAACCRVASRRDVKAYPPIGQGEFLLRMGIVSRAEQLIELDSTTEAEASNIVAGVRRLVDHGEMGKRFKVIAIADKGLSGLVGFPP